MEDATLLDHGASRIRTWWAVTGVVMRIECPRVVVRGFKTFIRSAELNFNGANCQRTPKKRREEFFAE